MKKLLLVAAALSLAPMSAMAVDGTITITGSVTGSTCKINNAASPAAIAVVLPQVSTTSLSALNDTAGTKGFTLALSECGSLTKATVYFEQGANTMANGNLRNAAVATPATNVQVRLLNADMTTPINVAGASGAQSSQTVDIVSGAADMNYFAQYFATGQSTAGNVSTSVQFTMQYQ